MSDEYVISATGLTKEHFAAAVAALQREAPSAQLVADASGMWIPSSTPGWIDFSLGFNERGIEIVSNLARQPGRRLIDIVMTALEQQGLQVEIEEI